MAEGDKKIPVGWWWLDSGGLHRITRSCTLVKRTIAGKDLVIWTFLVENRLEELR